MVESPEELKITAEQINQELGQQIPLLLFDLREKDVFEKSHIEGSVHAVCDTNAKEKIMPNIPRDTKIILISEPEQISKEVAQMMSSFGLDSHYLAGGFSSWNGSLVQGKTGKMISPETLSYKLEKVFLLDVRNPDEFSVYKIPGSNNIPLGELFNPRTLEKIPKDKEIVTICPHGNLAMIANFALARAGINVQTLAGGLAGWNQVLKAERIFTNSVKVIQVQKIGKGCLSHIVVSDGKSIVIDPLYPFEKYIEIANQEGFNIIGVFDTHQHADHVSGAKDLAKAAGATLYLSKYEGYMIDSNFIGDADTIHFGQSTLRVIHTPGHTPGSLSFVVNEKYVFTGDILFVESIGRPDLRDKAEEFTEELYNTLHTKLLKLPDDTMVFPTHYSENAKSINNAYFATIKKSKKLPWLDLPKQEFVTKIMSITTPRPSNYQKIILVNRGELEIKSTDIPELEIGPNRCAIEI